MTLRDDRDDHLVRLRRLPLRRKIRLAWQLRRDPGVSQIAKLPLILVIAYVVSPFNILPKWLPIIRRFDNLIVAALGLWLFVKLVPHDLLEEHLNRVEKRPRIVDTIGELRS